MKKMSTKRYGVYCYAIDYIDVLFNYNFETDTNIDYDYEYYIDGIITVSDRMIQIIFYLLKNKFIKRST